MPVDFTPLCCGLFVWVGGTTTTWVAARRYQAAHADRVSPVDAVFVTGIVSVTLLLVGFGIMVSCGK